MNRRSKIIVSVVGIFIVLLALVGITYAYFLTQVQGNTNDTSINLTTANLKLEYSEDTNEIIVAENIFPNYSVEKIFYATNKGNSKVDYIVTLENVLNEFVNKADLVYIVTCESLNTETGETSGTCNEVTDETRYPDTSSMVTILQNSIDVNLTHKYKLTVTYKETGRDQSDDMGKTFKGLVNIRDAGHKSESEKTLEALGLTVTPGTPDFSQTTTDSGIYAAEDNYGTSYYFRGNLTNNNVIFGKETVYSEYCFSTTDYDNPEYYIGYEDGIRYVTYEECEENNFYCEGYAYKCYNNYIDCLQSSYGYGSGECEALGTPETKDIIWEIIRINGNGTLRIERTTDITNGADVGSFYYSDQWSLMNQWYVDNLQQDYEKHISKNTLFCSDYNYYEIVKAYDEAAEYYECTVEEECQGFELIDAYKHDFANRITNPSLYCNPPRVGQSIGMTQLTVGNGLTYPIGLITADEARMINKTFGWTMTPGLTLPNYGSSNYVGGIGYVSVDYGPNSNVSYPVINLNADYARTLVWDSELNAYISNQ